MAINKIIKWGWIFISLVIVFNVTVISYPQEENNNQDVIKALKLTISSDRPEYLPLQQVFITARLENTGDKTIKINSPDLVGGPDKNWNHEIAIYLSKKDADFDKRYWPFGIYSSGVSPPVNLKGKEEIIQKYKLLYPIVIHKKMFEIEYGDVIFAEPGSYKIMFTYEKGLKSNIINITVKEPRDIDKKAYEYLKNTFKDKHFLIEFLTLPYPMRIDKKNLINRIEKLEAFLDLYSKSAYAPYVQSILGFYYFCSGKYEKAIEILKKVVDQPKRFGFTDDALYHIGRSYYYLEKLDEAEKWLKRLEKEVVITYFMKISYIKSLKESIESERESKQV